MEKKFVTLNKNMYTVEDGKVVISSEELATAIQNAALDLFIDEEANLSSDAKCLCCC